MAINFKRSLDSVEDTLSINMLTAHGNLTSDEINRLKKIREAWNFYEGYHWEDIEDTDSRQTTFNYCSVFVNKFVSFEFGKGFNIKLPISIENVEVTNGDTKIEENLDTNDDGVLEEEEETTRVIREKTTTEFLDQVWEYNNRDIFCTELGQTKSVTGEAWVKVQFIEPEELNDPFKEFPDGKIRVTVVPTQYVYPTYNEHDKDQLDELLIQYPIARKRNTGIIFKREEVSKVMYKEVWTKDTIRTYEDDVMIEEFLENPYNIIPFVQIKNFPLAGREHGVGDLEDIIPLNIELNTKRSDISEVIDYHSAPVTLVYGAKIGNLEKGANKVWGGLPKDSKVENLELKGDLSASTNYTNTLKTSMCEIGSIPETVLGGSNAISNTSGVALQYMNLPLIERTRIKRISTQRGLELVNKLILHIAVIENLIEIPEGVSLKDFITTKVTLPDTLPKDELLELNKIESEMKLALECRQGALERMGRDNIQTKLSEIDNERKAHPEIFNPALQQTWYNNNYGANAPQINSGMTNSQTPLETLRIETTGKNGGQ